MYSRRPYDKGYEEPPSHVVLWSLEAHVGIESVIDELCNSYSSLPPIKYGSMCHLVNCGGR